MYNQGFKPVTFFTEGNFVFLKKMGWAWYSVRNKNSVKHYYTAHVKKSPISVHTYIHTYFICYAGQKKLAAYS